MSIDFEIPAEAKAIREKVRQWVHDECIPAEKELDTKPLAEVLGPLRAKARARTTIFGTFTANPPSNLMTSPNSEMESQLA